MTTVTRTLLKSIDIEKTRINLSSLGGVTPGLIYIVDVYRNEKSYWTGTFDNLNDARNAANYHWSLVHKAVRNAQAIQRTEVTEGFYEVEGTVYKVQRSESSGHLYGKRLDINEDGSHEWVYARGAVADIRRYGQPLGEETAAQFGKLYGTCMICGRRLSNEESIARGIGPICAENMGW